MENEISKMEIACTSCGGKTFRVIIQRFMHERSFGSEPIVRFTCTACGHEMSARFPLLNRNRHYGIKLCENKRKAVANAAKVEGEE